MAWNVLVVDDHASVRRLLETVVGEDSRFDRVSTAEGIAQALVVAERERPDVVLLDADLRGVDGLSAIGPLKERAPGAAVIVFSSAPYASDRTARAAGADRFVEKGTDLDVLLDVLVDAVAGLAQQRVVDLREPESAAVPDGL